MTHAFVEQPIYIYIRVYFQLCICHRSVGMGILLHRFLNPFHANLCCNFLTVPLISTAESRSGLF